MSNLIWLFFIVKHFVCDFPLQKSRHFMNKGTYGHWGGIEHALIHALPTGFFLLGLTHDINLSIQLAFFEFLIHYHVDWFKMWWNAKKKYTPADSMFWIWLGIDQMVHYLTYWLIIEVIV